MTDYRPDGAQPAAEKPKYALGIYIACAFLIAAVVVYFGASHL